MKCYKCKKQMSSISSSYIKKIENKIIIIENTPTYVCNYCYKDFYIDEAIRNIEEIVQNVEYLPIKLIVIDYKDIRKYFFN